MASTTEKSVPAKPYVPPAERLRNVLSNARQRNGLPLTEKSLIDHARWVRSLARRGLLDSDTLRDSTALRDSFWKAYTSPSSRSFYVRALQCYISCLSDVDLNEQYPSVDRVKMIELLQSFITDCNQELKLTKRS